MLKVLTFNAAILDVRIFGHSFYRPLDHIEARLRELAVQLKQSSADLVFLQEVFHYDKQRLLLHFLDAHYPHKSQLARRGWKLRLDNELLILSRYPLANGKLVRFKSAPAEELRHTSKGFYHVETEIPGLGKLNLVNFHMSAGGKHHHPQSASMESIRARQIQQLLDYCRSMDCLLLAGDLNAGLQTSVANYQQVINAGYVDLFLAGQGTGLSWDPDNILVKMGTESHLPAQRIDHIFADSRLLEKMQVHDAEVIFKEKLVNTPRGNMPLSDHYGISARLKPINETSFVVDVKATSAIINCSKDLRLQ